MTQSITQAEFHALTDLPDWRALLRRIEATFRAPSFSLAVEFVSAVTVAAESAGHLPDIDIRSPGVVRIVLTTRSARGLSDLDIDLARTISALAASSEMASEPTAASRAEIAIDALDIAAVLPFWRAVFAYEDEAPPLPGEEVRAVVDPQRIGPSIWFQQMDEPRIQRNRIHLDMTVPHDVAESRIAAALAAGGRMVNDESARAFWVLADVEGNEVCICTWQDR